MLEIVVDFYSSVSRVRLFKSWRVSEQRNAQKKLWQIPDETKSMRWLSFWISFRVDKVAVKVIRDFSFFCCARELSTFLFDFFSLFCRSFATCSGINNINTKATHFSVCVFFSLLFSKKTTNDETKLEFELKTKDCFYQNRNFRNRKNDRFNRKMASREKHFKVESERTKSDKSIEMI